MLTIVMCLTTEKTKLMILLIFTTETLDLVIFSVDTGYGNLIMSYLLFVRMII